METSRLQAEDRSRLESSSVSFRAMEDVNAYYRALSGEHEENT
ncbi:MAG: hypothetical protein ABSB76_40445 [Streptosporangiaceae bacterium]